MPIILLAVIILLALMVAASCVRIVPQAHAMIIERLGMYKETWSTGLHFKLPFFDRIAKRVNLKEQVVDFAPQPVITKDNVTMRIDTVVFFQITDPRLFAYGVENPIMAIENLTATTLRNIIGDMELDATLTSREIINTKMRASLDVATDPWGIKVNRVELKNIIPPSAIQEAMEKQMKAERERREAILIAEGQKKSTILVAEGKKASAILDAEAEKQAAILRAEAEKEKMIMGELYLAFGEELTNERQHAKEVLYEYNMLKPNEIEKRDNLLRGLFGSVGEKFYIEPPFRCDYGYNIHWGENSYANYNLTVLDCAKVVIGDDVLIGPNVNIFTAAHPISPSQRKLGLEFAKDIEIGDGSWIGGATTINPGVKIGKNVVIGSGSVVTKDIPDNTIAVGNPCRVIKTIDKE